MPTSIFDFEVNTIDGAPKKLSDYQGKVLLIVNVASKCGLTPQYAELEKLYQAYKERGFEILGFPANQFAEQEPGSNAEIKSFCSLTYGVSFPMFEKIIVKGEGCDPLYAYLTEKMPEKTLKHDGILLEKLASRGLLSGQLHEITWNFEKFLISKQGEILRRFSPEFAPMEAEITKAIELALA